MTDLCKIGLKMRVMPKFSSEGGAMSLTSLPPPPTSLLAMNGPLPAELKFRENALFAGYSHLYY